MAAVPRFFIIVLSAVLLSAAPCPAVAGDGAGGGDRDGQLRARVEELAAELADTANSYGPDALTVQVLLLMESMKAGALAPSEVEVVGPSPDLGPGHLRIRVDTGIIFEAGAVAVEDSDRRVWDTVARPVLARLESARFEPAGLELLLVYGLQDSGRTSGDLDPTEPFTPRSFALGFTAFVLDELIAGRLAPDDLFAAGSPRGLPGVD